MFLGAEDGTVYACSLDGGAVEWTYKTNDKITAAPLVDGNRVYVSSWDNYVYALNAANGEEIWKANTGDIVSVTPLLSEGTLYVTTRKGRVFAIDVETGLERWTVNSRSPISFSATMEDGVLFVPTGGRKLLALRATDGELLADLPAQDMKTSAVPVDGKLYFVTFNDSADRDELWSFTTASAHGLAGLETDLPEQRTPLSADQTD
jgi:outer membrane protein assembly factor BamB